MRCPVQVVQALKAELSWCLGLSGSWDHCSSAGREDTPAWRGFCGSRDAGFSLPSPSVTVDAGQCVHQRLMIPQACSSSKRVQATGLAAFAGDLDGNLPMITKLLDL